MLTAVLDTESDISHVYSKLKPPLPTSSQNWKQQQSVPTYESYRLPYGQIGYLEDQKEDEQDYDYYRTRRASDSRSHHEEQVQYANEDEPFHNDVRHAEYSRYGYNQDDFNMNSRGSENQDDIDADVDPEIELEERVLTPNRLQNRRKWIQLAKQASTELQEFAALESTIAERSRPDASEDHVISAHQADKWESHQDEGNDVTPTKQRQRVDAYDERIEYSQTNVSPRRVTGTQNEERHALSIHRLLEDSALLSLSETSENEAGNPALLADLETADISAIEQTDMTQTSIVVERADVESIPHAEEQVNCLRNDSPQENKDNNQASNNSLQSNLASERPPSPSKLLQKFFPKSAIPARKKSQSAVDESEYQKLKERVNALEGQVFKLKEQNHKLTRERDELQRNVKRVEAQKADFEKYRAEEMARMKAIHEEEMKALKRDRQLWEKQRKAAEILPSKKERQEIEALKQQLQQQFQSAKQKENRILLAQDRLKKKLEEVTKRNNELQDEIKILEQERAAFVELHRSRQSRMTELPTAPKNSSLGQVKIIKHEPVVKRQSMEELRVQNHNIGNQVNGQGNPSAELSSLPIRRKHSSSKTGTVKEDPEEKARLDELQKALGLVKPVETKRLDDGSIERRYGNGTILSRLCNGTLKQLRSDGIEIIYLINKDQKTIYPDGRCVYWYAEPKTLQTMYPDGTQVFEFATGQYEKHYPDGRQDIVFPDNTKKYIHSDGQEEVCLPDGRVYRVDANGNRIMEYPNGFREII